MIRSAYGKNSHVHQESYQHHNFTNVC